MGCINNFCPVGRAVCDGCKLLTSAGCSLNTSVSYSHTLDDDRSYYDKKFNEMMQLSKETLVELLIGRRP